MGAGVVPQASAQTPVVTRPVPYRDDDDLSTDYSKEDEVGPHEPASYRATARGEWIQLRIGSNLLAGRSQIRDKRGCPTLVILSDPVTDIDQVAS